MSQLTASKKQVSDTATGSNTWSVNPGGYSAVEDADPDYTMYSNSGPVTVTSGGQGTITIGKQAKLWLYIRL
ncbi:MAG: hypothetical protein U5N58_11605 [Actinomycetota bacterium]|nr:hypothetical protein [Actinomycetota bacterium]